MKNPEGFAGIFIASIKDVLANHVAEKIEYHAEESVYPEYSADTMFPEEVRHSASELVAGTEKTSLYDFVQYDSDNERSFIDRINDDPLVINYFKFPANFKVHIPRIINNYNPDWGILRWNENRTLKMELVRETKGNIDLAMLQYSNEGRKIKCARKHFASLGVSYRHITKDTTDWWKEEDRVEEKPLIE